MNYENLVKGGHMHEVARVQPGGSRIERTIKHVFIPSPLSRRELLIDAGILITGSLITRKGVEVMFSQTTEVNRISGNLDQIAANPRPERLKSAREQITTVHGQIFEAAKAGDVEKGKQLVASQAFEEARKIESDWQLRYNLGPRYDGGASAAFILLYYVGLLTSAGGLTRLVGNILKTLEQTGRLKLPSQPVV